LEAVGKLLMQWKACIPSCSVDCLFSLCQFAFDRDNDGFAYSKTMRVSNLSLSLSHKYHHADALQLMNGKEGSKQHFWENRGGLLPCKRNVVCVCLSLSLFWHEIHVTSMMTSYGRFFGGVLNFFWRGLCVFFAGLMKFA
jgi:hypothetical protein